MTYIIAEPCIGVKDTANTWTSRYSLPLSGALLPMGLRSTRCESQSAAMTQRLPHDRAAADVRVGVRLGSGPTCTARPLYPQERTSLGRPGRCFLCQ